MRTLREVLAAFKAVTSYSSSSNAVEMKQTQPAKNNTVDESGCSQADVLQKALWEALQTKNAERIAPVVKQILEEVSGYRFKSWPTTGFKEEMNSLVNALQLKSDASITFYAPDNGLSRVILGIPERFEEQSSVTLSLSARSTEEAQRRWHKLGYAEL